MKIGIMTFHWATNYGAVMQAYALSEYLTRNGADVRIIDYYPYRLKTNKLNAFRTRHLSHVPQRLRTVEKEKNIEAFRRKYLRRTKYYSSNRKLQKENFAFDCFICGSDQIWNESFLSGGERKKTYSYLLNFAPANKIIASYAASFGVTKYKENLKKHLKKYLKRFDFVSVRENSGLDILNGIGINNACVVPDPTLLLKKSDYEKLLSENIYTEKYTFVYLLHGKMNNAADVIEYSQQQGNKTIKCGNVGIEDWLTRIYYAEHVITNSFHGIVFAIIFQKPFTAILIKGSGMNDRISTLLDTVGLTNQIYRGDTAVFNNKIDWDMVSHKLEQYREIGYDYIKNILSYQKGWKINEN